MNYIPLEGIRAKWASISFGMDDKYDRLIRKTTTFLFLLGALIIASDRHFGMPISCATSELPSGIPQHWIDTVCWIADKKSAPYQFIGDRSTKNTSFYQCTVETLIFVSILILLPGQLWKILLGQSGYHLKTIFALITAAKQAVGDQRTIVVEELAIHLQASRRYHRLHWNFDRDLARRLGHLKPSWRRHRLHPNCFHQNRYFIPALFILIKLVYILTIPIIYFILSYCLGFDYISFGLQILQKCIFNQMQTVFDERYFPQRTWCRISRLKLGGVIDETWVDCVLPINIINNLIFILIWFWLLVVFVSTFYGLLKTLWQMQPCNTEYFLGQHLYAHNLYDIAESAVTLQFIEKCPPDIALILRLYEIELGNKLVGEIIGALYLIYKKDIVILDSSIAEHLP